MWHTKRAVDSVAVSGFYLIIWVSLELVVASLAEVMSSIAKIDSHTAAEIALPVNVLGTMLFT